MTTFPTELPPSPRPITVRARRRSMNEAPVRGWMVLTVVVAGVMGYLTWARFSTAWQEKTLIDNGTPVMARVTRIGLNMSKTERRDERLSVELTYTPPGGREMVVAGELPPKPGSTVNLVDPLPIKVDPYHPERWTDRTEPQSIAQQLAAVFLLAPLLVLTIATLLVQRRRVLRVFRDGQLSRATVVSVKQSPLAPQSRHVRFHLPGETAVHGCLCPNRLASPTPGEEIEVLHLKRARVFLCAAAYA